jgi:cytochrome c peroxidase
LWVVVALAATACRSRARGEKSEGASDRPAPAAAAPPPSSASAPRALPRDPQPPLTAREALGREMFFDARLSNPPGTSCASCHDPARAFSGNHGSTIGVALGSRPGHHARRNTPSVLYMRYIEPFHFALEDDDDIAQSPFGGLGWGGRASSVAEFSRLPLFDPDEMNNAGEAEIAAKLRSAPYAGRVAAEFPGALETASGTLAALGQALEAFLTSAAMSPFTSKYDDYLRHAVTLTPLEMRGLLIFKNPEKGACNACHPFEDSSNRPSRSMFTNYGYDGLAVPRNAAIPANRNPAYFDLGLCERRDANTPSSGAEWCSRFRAPSLRNVAVRERFMHNGAFKRLRDVVAFYATRSTNPTRWYPPSAKFDDVPSKYRENVNVTSLPYNRREGATPAFDDDEVDAIVAFLETLTDAAYRAK